jgi:antitoxin (DNA-binding transcriptional repressor) of toxin-antitoxin stability system
MGGGNMQVNISEFENSFHKYYDYAKKSEVVVFENGRPVIRLSPVVRLKKTKTNVDDLVGVFSKCRDIELKDAREERLKRYEIAD